MTAPHSDTIPNEAPDLVDALAQLSFVILNALTEIAGEYELSIVQIRLLGVLRDREPKMNTLGRHLGLDKSSISGLVDRAQRRGLVIRTPSETDGRSFRVSITESGRQIAEKISTAYAERIATLTGTLTPQECQLLAQLANRIIVADARRHGIDLSIGRH
jgi:DNA-binding MarR family transcriptional regulator